LTNEREVADYPTKAREELAAAKMLLAHPFTAAALSRAYYAMYHTTQALLLSIGKSYSSHKGTINGFGQFFVKTGRFPAEFHKRLTTTFAMRMEGDYNPLAGLDTVTVTDIYRWAAEFLAAAEAYLYKE